MVDIYGDVPALLPEHREALAARAKTPAAQVAVTIDSLERMIRDMENRIKWMRYDVETLRRKLTEWEA